MGDLAKMVKKKVVDRAITNVTRIRYAPTIGTSLCNNGKILG